ncbi:aspartate--tRNA ligase [Lacticigenium naphthae]|uniref:aspartate--tRNA ligase n=1 Tax=Lacticigenium naphthae TaxID=515351 RepID=UPI00040C704F|nr:aspartate--tRNA ligase [Lacticigenium naphthae]
MKRSNYCGLVNESDIDKEVILKGWVQKRRDLGGMIFLDLRDREGIIQVVANGDLSKEVLEIADSVRSEYVIEVKGIVQAREVGAINPNMVTGKVEVIAQHIEVLNKSKLPPFYIEDNITVSDELRLKHRYLDLRRPEMAKNLILRNQTTKAIRNYLDEKGFLDVETPYLTKSTPEGARDYLVPSRVQAGKFYALPQSPQLFKQLLMGAGFDRYYQIVRCFRDEDLRGDRQPEFTQVDIETSFMEADEIREIMEEMILHVVEETKGKKVSLPLPQLTYDEAMERFGSDKPDIRFAMELKDVSSIVETSDFKVFSSTVKAGNVVKGLTVKGAANQYSRKNIDELTEFASIYGAKGLAWMKVTEEGLTGPIAKFFSGTDLEDKMVTEMGAEPGDLLLFVADKETVAYATLGALRVRLGKELRLYNEDELAFVWIVNWPLLEYSEEEGRYTSAHHPFTMPNQEDLQKLDDHPEEVYANAYDIVLNGYEIGGGSLRIHNRELQEKMFAILGFTKEESEKQFGFLLDALDYGFPPHGGIAFGLDRLVMILAKEENIREVIAFPKNSKAVDPLTEAPSSVSAAQLAELHIQTQLAKKNKE